MGMMVLRLHIPILPPCGAAAKSYVAPYLGVPAFALAEMRRMP